ncbi:MAG: ABC transporter permease [Dehalococcoidia bacterium]
MIERGVLVDSPRGEPAGAFQVVLPARGRAGGALKLARRNPLGTASAAIILLLIVTAIAAPLIAPHDPTATNPREKLQGTTAAHLLGTDNLGRDIFSQIVLGARTSLWAGVSATICGTILGAIIGMLSGFIGGRTDYLIQRGMDSLQAMPLIVLLLVIVVALGPSLWNIVWALSIGILPAAGRIIRSATLSVKNEGYIESARVIGCRPVRIAFRHVLPNVTAHIIVIASVTIGGAILAEAALSFLGLGVPPPTPSWGGMLSSAGRRYFEEKPSLAIYPGLAISITVLAFNLLGDTLRDVFDPRLRGH